MMSDSDKVDREAAEWVVQLSDPEADPAETREQFLHWLRLAPEHRQVLVQTIDVACALGALDRARQIDVQELIQHGSNKVIELDLVPEGCVGRNAAHPAAQLKTG